MGVYTVMLASADVIYRWIQQPVFSDIHSSDCGNGCWCCQPANAAAKTAWARTRGVRVLQNVTAS